MRKCNTCNSEIVDGIVVDYGTVVAYYCDDCKPDNYNALYNSGLAYWTSWDDEIITEWCPHCEAETELIHENKYQSCGNCGESIAPCSMYAHPNMDNPENVELCICSAGKEVV